MYCRNCGKQLPEEAIFCGNCGTKIREQNVVAGNQVVKSANPVNSVAGWEAMKSDMGKLAAIVLMGLAVFWSMISGLVPLVEGSIPFTLSVEWSLVNIWKDIEFLAEIGADATFLMLVAGACMILYLVAIVCGLEFFYDIFAIAGRKENIKTAAMTASICSGIATLIIILGQSIVNAETESYMIGLTFLSVLPTGWINIVVAILNVLLFTNLYKRTENSMNVSTEGAARECVACGTKYKFGKCCPNCGSSFIKK